MNNQNLVEAQRWLKQAEHDLNAAEWNAEGEFFENSCFLVQQSAEKALKAFLFSKGERTFVSHSTLILARKAATYAKEFEKLSDDCRLLDKFYVPTRYPDSIPDGIPHDYYTMKDAAAALEAGERIIKFVKGKLKL